MKKITKASGAVKHTAKKVVKRSNAKQQTMKNKRAGYKDANGSFTRSSNGYNSSINTIE